MLSRRAFLKLTAAGGAAAFIASRARFLQTVRAAQSPQLPLPPTAIPQFAEPLPDIEAIAGQTSIELHMKELKTNMLPAGAVPGYTGTYVWGYLKPGQDARASYLGPLVVAQRGVPIEMKFVNMLGDANATNVLAYRYSTDQTLHWADPLNGEANMWNHMAMPPEPGSEGAENYLGSIPAAVHLHGGEVPPTLDGGPDAWFTSDGNYVGHGYYSKDGSDPKNYAIYRYPNTQEAAPIWFHDHTLGATRLNVYCGLAGGYLLTDPANEPANQPPAIPLIIQDRMFDTAGQLFFPAASMGGILYALNPEHPYWNPEFVGDVICVNGKAWPFKDVAAQRYSLVFINGSNARAYEMAFTDPVSGNPGPQFWVVGTDGGWLDRPVRTNKLTMMPGERYRVIVDFANFRAGLAGPNGRRYSGRWLLKNTAKVPFPNGAAAQGKTTGRIMEFRVQGGPVADGSYNPAAAGAVLRSAPMVRLANPVSGTLAAGVTVHKTRQLTLNEVMGMPQTAIDPVTGLPTAFPGGPLEVLVNNTKWSGERIIGVEEMDGMMMHKFEPIPGFTKDGLDWNYLSELPNEGETETWEIINLTADAHPIHLHLVQFQLINRQNFDVAKYTAAYDGAFPGGGYDHMTGQPYPAGVYMPAFGPPLNYNQFPNGAGNPPVVGGNPDVNVLGGRGRPVYLKGKPRPPLAYEAGWKDTVIMYPGQVTRIAVRWAPTDLPASTPKASAFFPFDPRAGGYGYVWHCHIVDHEDNEMMRPDEVVPNPNANREYELGEDY